MTAVERFKGAKNQAVTAKQRRAMDRANAQVLAKKEEIDNETLLEVHATLRQAQIERHRTGEITDFFEHATREATNFIRSQGMAMQLEPAGIHLFSMIASRYQIELDEHLDDGSHHIRGTD